jgi:nitrate/TMAO reductase-like tetraheme cytochrome c subunit
VTNETQPGNKTGVSRHRHKLLFLMFAGAISIVLLAIGGYQYMEFTDSTDFCGRLCHEVMYPEYTAYQASPHSRVACSQCHVGYGGSYLVRSKISGIPQIWFTLTNSYPRPILTPVKNLRPARETCEQCHRPERFAGDLVLTHTTYDEDEANTAHTDTRTMRVGGGEAETARDIHWHIAANVYYLPLDEERQNIGWVGVEDKNGNLTEYIDPKQADKVTPERIAREKRLMDCVDCHNRATHIYQSPEDLIDTAMFQGSIDKTLPYIKWLGVNALDPVNPSLEQADEKVEVIKEFYRLNYPDVYADKSAEIDKAIEELKNVAKLTTFTHMHVTWTTYPDNIGHQKSPGCFRCHGKLEAVSGDQKGSKIDVSCNLCHYLQ